MSIIFKTRLDDFVYGMGWMAAKPGLSRAWAGGPVGAEGALDPLEDGGRPSMTGLNSRTRNIVNMLPRHEVKASKKKGQEARP
jgi:hypothetical protein